MSKLDESILELLQEMNKRLVAVENNKSTPPKNLPKEEPKPINYKLVIEAKPAEGRYEKTLDLHWELPNGKLAFFGNKPAGITRGKTFWRMIDAAYNSPAIKKTIQDFIK